MVLVRKRDTKAIFEIQGLHKLWALKSRIEIPIAHICNARIYNDTDDRWWKGIRAPGTFIPGFITAGTFHRDGKKLFWDVVNTKNAIVIDLENESYDQLIIEVRNPAALIAEFSN